MHRALRSLIFFLFALAPCAWAQSDYHLTQDPNRWIYYDSPFAHGHRHGYEEGFHAGDEDYHFRRPGAARQRMSHQRGYRPEFGNKSSFMAGFESGFLAGYADSYAGRPFRAANNLDPRGEVYDRIQHEQVMDFDSGVAEGYRGGFSNAVNIAGDPGVSASAVWRCRQEQHSVSFCDGFGPGYVLGRGDSESAGLMAKAVSSATVAKNTH